MNTQIIEKNGQPEWAVIPYDDYRQLLELAEELEDIRDFDAAMTSQDELIPHAVVSRLVEGENPLRVWREYRGLSQSQLADLTDTNKSTIISLEAGDRTGQTEILGKIALVMKVDIDDSLT